MGRPQEEQHNMVPCKNKDSGKQTIQIDECWPVSNGRRAGDAYTMSDTSPVGWQGCLMWIPQWAGPEVVWGSFNNVPGGLSEPSELDVTAPAG